MKKTLSLILAFLVCLTMSVPAFSAAVPEGKEVSSGDYETPFDNSRFFEYGDYTIHFRVLKAENEKDRIMMIHGFALSGFCWNELAARLVSEGYTCVIPDLPDFGYSTRENGSFPCLPREEIIHALMTYLYDGQWIIAGHSMGGFIALSLAEKYPESVSALMLYSTSGNDGMPGAVRKIFQSRPVACVMGAFMDLCASNDIVFNLILKYALQDNGYYAAYDKAMIKEPARIKGTGMGAVYSFASLNATDYEGLKNSGKPVFFCNGGSDSVISRSAKDKLALYLPENSVNTVIPGGGHMFIENMADEVAAGTLSFLGGIR